MNLPAHHRTRAVRDLALLTMLALTASLAGCGGSLPAPKAGQVISIAMPAPAPATAGAAGSVASAILR